LIFLRWRGGVVERFADGAAAGVVLALDRPHGHAIAGVLADRGVLRAFRGVVALDVFFGVAPCGRPGGGGGQLGQGVQARLQLAAGERGELAGVDGAVAAGGLVLAR
jgi:hypothetical protein